ncbi:hypothetical protein CXY01_05720 [Cellulomonas xylanilytica]|uniref:Uncharacterized protein n=1 Tax=Cellulomonas xylanilytica TaxID=233583 RepID=A0A510UZF2_9CELL|nr:hypothetical protein CXY01_05720 [Cellulomonas xylanilytica]
MRPGWSRCSLMSASVPPGARRARAPTLRVPDQPSGAWDRWDRGDGWDVARPAQRTAHPVASDASRVRGGQSWSASRVRAGQSWSASRPSAGKTAARVARIDLSTSSPGS